MRRGTTWWKRRNGARRSAVGKQVQLNDWRSKKLRLGVGLWFLGLAVIVKFIVIVLSIAIGEGTISFFTGPLLFFGFFVGLSEYDTLAAKLAHAEARLIGSETPRRTRRWAAIFGWIWGVILGLTLALVVVAMAMRESAPESTDASPTLTGNQAGVGAAVSPTTTIDRTLQRTQQYPTCDSVISAQPGDETESTCVYANSPETWHNISRWGCRSSRDVYFSVPTADDFSMVWYAASYDTEWALVSDADRPQLASERCRPDDYNPDLPPSGLPGVDQWVLYSPFDETSRLRVHAISLLTGEDKVFLPSDTDPFVRYGDVVVSPDGNTVAYVAGRGTPHGDVFVVDASGANTRQVNGEALMAEQLSWTTDGTSLVVVARMDERRNYLMFDLATGEETLLFSHSGSSELVGVLDDAIVVRTYDAALDEMAYLTISASMVDVVATYVLDGVQREVVVDRANSRLLYSTGGPYVDRRRLHSLSLVDGTVDDLGPYHLSQAPTPSPDGELLAFGHGDGYPRETLFAVGSDGLSEQWPASLGTLGAQISFLEWTPDADAVVVGLGERNEPGSMEIVHVDLDGTAATLEINGVPLGILEG